MGKTLSNIIHNSHVIIASQIACVIPADVLIAASVSIWVRMPWPLPRHSSGLMRTGRNNKRRWSRTVRKMYWTTIEKDQETRERRVARIKQPCWDDVLWRVHSNGVTGQLAAMVDGMSLEISVQCFA